jgi:acetyl-CoA carboxylase carboxyl transferase subunit alpha
MPRPGRGPSTYLAFERPLARLDREIARRAETDGRDGERLRRLRAERRRVQKEILARLTPWERVELSRHPDRPAMLDYVGALCRDFVELHGDRCFGDDGAIVGGIARLRGRGGIARSRGRGGVARVRGRVVVIVGQQRGRTTGERIARNFGMARPEGYRKAVRLFELAERFGRPVVTFVDTQGADPGIGAEERGQSEAIATTLRTLATLRVPIVSAVGGSGGALALGLADRVLMQEHAWYSVISPEGCAAILFRQRTPETVARSAALLRLTAMDLAEFGVVDAIVREPGGGAHRQPARAAVLLGRALDAALETLVDVPPRALLARRYARHRRLGTDLRAP